MLRPILSKIIRNNNDLQFQVLDWNHSDILQEESESDSDSDSNSNSNNKNIKQLNIRAYGVTEEGYSICLTITGFKPYFYIKVPDNWKDKDLQSFLSVLNNNKGIYYAKKGVASVNLVKKKEFYGFSNNEYFNYAIFIFHSYMSYCAYMKILKEKVIEVPTIRKTKMKSNQMDSIKYDFTKMTYESKVNPLLRFFHVQNIDPTGMLKVSAKKYVIDHNKTSRCQLNIVCDYKEIKKVDKNVICPFIVASFDIECTSKDGTFPKANRPDDYIIQIGTTVYIFGKDECSYKYVATLKKCDPIEGVHIESFETERELLIGWARFIARLDPDILTGYNIWGFDWEYIYRRALLADNPYHYEIIQILHRLNNKEYHDRDWVEQKLASSALGDNTLKYINIEGIAQIDLLKVVQKDYKLDSYKLDKVAEHFMKMNKVDLSPRQLFENFTIGTSDKISEIAIYCVMDCELVNKLINKLQVITNNIGMSNVCIVPFSYLFLRGQGIKIFSLVAKFCADENFLIKDLDKDLVDSSSYEGAIVFVPKPGIYFEPVAVMDYNSLYPSSMISENISHDSILGYKEYRVIDSKKLCKDNIEYELVEDTIKDRAKYDNLEGYHYNDIEYDVYEGIGDDKKKIGYKVCRFAELDSMDKAVLPRILKKLLKARKDTRKKMGYKSVTYKSIDSNENITEIGLFNETDEKIELNNLDTGLIKISKNDKNIEITEIKKTFNDFEISVLDGLQLAYKVTCNSLYGQVGATTSPICYKELAACTTATGRKMVVNARDYTLEHFKGSKLVYGDSVTGDTPILLRYYKSDINIKRISEIGLNWDPYRMFKPFDIDRYCKEQSRIHHHTEVWCNNKWTKIKRVIRHKTYKKIYRVTTDNGSVDVTEDHSLLYPNGEKLKPKDIVLNVTQLMSSYPLFDDNIRQYNNLSEINISKFFINSNESTLLSLQKMRAFISGYLTFDNRKSKISDHKEIEEIIYRLIFNENLTKLYISGAGDKERLDVEFLNTTNPDKFYCYLLGLYYNRDGDIIYKGNNKVLVSQIYYIFKRINLKDQELKFTVVDNRDFPFELRLVDKVCNNDANRVKSIKLISMTKGYVYDLETEDGIFQAGIGELIVKNTDSVFINFVDYIKQKFPDRNLTDLEILEHSIEAGKEAGAYVTSKLKSPQNLDYEKTFWPFCIFSKKRYIGNKYEEDINKFKQTSMGVVLKRRDNAPIVKTIYGGVIDIILNKRDIEGSKKFFYNSVKDLMAGNVNITQLIISKSIRSEYANPTLIPHKSLADRMGERDPGNKPQSNDRIQYCYIDKSNLKCYICNSKINEDKCKCVNCMKLFCYYHLGNHRNVCKNLCRFCKTEYQSEVDQCGAKCLNCEKCLLTRCKTCKGNYCVPCFAKHKKRKDKYDVIHDDKCKKELATKLIQGDIVEHPTYITQENLKIDYTYYLEHQIKKPVYQIFELVMKNPESIIIEIIRKNENSTKGNHEITEWFKVIGKNSDHEIKKERPTIKLKKLDNNKYEIAKENKYNIKLEIKPKENETDLEDENMLEDFELEEDNNETSYDILEM